MTPFDDVLAGFARLEGYEIEFLGYQWLEGRDSMSMTLRYGPTKRDAVVLFNRLCHLSLSKHPIDAEPMILDRVSVSVLLPGPEPWPPELGIGLVRSPELPPLLWMHTDGLVMVDVVAAQARLMW